MRERLAAAAVVLACAGSACRRPPAASYPEAPIVLISIDTLRADHLPLYGYKAGSTPAIDALGREGIVFEDVFSHCPLTLPAHASLLTGLLPPRHGVRDNIGFSLKESSRTLATRLKSAGLATGGAISAFVLRSQTGIARGFDFYEDALEIQGGTESLGSLQRDGSVAVEALARWIESQGDARFFAFLHLYEPHTPYAPPERHRQHPLAYDGDVSYADELLGAFLDRLKARGVYERAIIVVTSDHGEGLKDHREEEHGIFLYREAVHVPLILRLPGAAGGGRRIAGTVAQVDLAPTLLDLAGLPSDGTDGVTLRPSLGTGSAPARPVYSESFYPRYHFGWSELYSVTEARYRYIRAPRHELYDLGNDPGETRNIVESKASTAAAMSGWLEKTVAVGGVSTPEEVPADIREALQALGYIGAGRATADRTNLPDPKDRIDSYEDLKRGLALRRENKDAEAVEQFRKVLRDNPAMLDAWEMLGLTLLRMDRKAEGVEALGKAIELDPTRAEAHMALAKLYALDRKPDLAAKHAEIASGRDPGKGYEALAQVMMDMKRPDQAVAFARKSLESDPRRVMSRFILGVAAQTAGRYEEALGHFRKADGASRLQKQSVVLNLHANMADCLARLGREAEAEAEFRAEIEAIPWSREGRVGLATLYRSQGRDVEARAALEGLMKADPRPGPDTYWTIVRTFSVLGDAAAAREWATRARARYPTDPRFK